MHPAYGCRKGSRISPKLSESESTSGPSMRECCSTPIAPYVFSGRLPKAFAARHLSDHDGAREAVLMRALLRGVENLHSNVAEVSSVRITDHAPDEANR
jgi:hypothetical protein